jgi:hypothetical protein
VIPVAESSNIINNRGANSFAAGSDLELNVLMPTVLKSETIQTQNFRLA